jgi:hypothetical protein
MLRQHLASDRYVRLSRNQTPTVGAWFVYISVRARGSLGVVWLFSSLGVCSFFTELAYTCTSIESQGSFIIDGRCWPD